MAPCLGEELTPLVLKQICSAYSGKAMNRTIDVQQDMAKDELYEADLVKFFDEVQCIKKVEKAHSPKRSHEKNTHYYLKGKSIDGRDVFCKVSSSYHPVTGEFVCWTLTSFCEWKDNC
jgi:hypothetical protein